VSNLVILGIEKTQFDNIADRTYQPPPNTPGNVEQLILLLAHPTMIKDQPQILTEESHKHGWAKAKETTSLSFSGAHFGHYKASMTNKTINQLHTLLTDIPLRTGFSYKQWKKEINVMLEKIAGNCNVTKLRIILLFKADFNQLNKFIGKEMMYQVEEQIGCGRTIWEPTWKKCNNTEPEQMTCL